MPVLEEEWYAVMTHIKFGYSLNPSLTKLMMFIKRNRRRKEDEANIKYRRLTKAALEINETTLEMKVKYPPNWLKHFKGIVCHFGKYAYSLSCQALDEKMISLPYLKQKPGDR